MKLVLDSYEFAEIMVEKLSDETFRFAKTNYINRINPYCEEQVKDEWQYRVKLTAYCTDVTDIKNIVKDDLSLKMETICKLGLLGDGFDKVDILEYLYANNKIIKIFKNAPGNGKTYSLIDADYYTNQNGKCKEFKSDKQLLHSIESQISTLE